MRQSPASGRTIPGTIPALTIRQPSAWAILNIGKDIENRTWKTPYRGPMLVHAAKGMTRPEYLDVMEWIEDNIADWERLPGYDELQRGGIVGIVDVVDCVTKSDSPWFFGPFGFKLANPLTLRFVPWKGQLGIFRVPASVGLSTC